MGYWLGVFEGESLGVAGEGKLCVYCGSCFWVAMGMGRKWI